MNAYFILTSCSQCSAVQAFYATVSLTLVMCYFVCSAPHTRESAAEQFISMVATPAADSGPGCDVDEDGGDCVHALGGRRWGARTVCLLGGGRPRYLRGASVGAGGVSHPLRRVNHHVRLQPRCARAWSRPVLHGGVGMKSRMRRRCYIYIWTL